MAGDYSFGTAMGGSSDPTSDILGNLLTYGANSEEETPGQPNSAPNVKSDASAPLVPQKHLDDHLSQASQAPTYTPPDRSGLNAAQARLVEDQKVSSGKDVQPKWWERGLGGLTAGMMAFGRMPGAVEAGQAVTNRRFNAAELERGGRVRSDQAAIQAWEDGQKQSQQEFQNKNEAYRTKQEGVRTDMQGQQNAQQQANADRNFNRETANDKFNQNRDTQNDSWEHGFKTDTQDETGRHNRVDESLRGRELGIAGSRERREARKQANDDKLSSPEVRQQQLANQAEDKYGTMVDQLETGNPKGATPQEVKGFKATYREASASSVNPETQEPWSSPKEKEDYLQGLKQANADRKNSIMQRYSQDMGRLGFDKPVIQYDAEGNPVQRRGGQQQQQQSAPPQNAPAPATNKQPANQTAQGTIQKPPRPGTPLTDRAIVTAYLKAANGDTAQARKAAAKDGWKF